MSVKTESSASRIKVHDLPEESVRSGGEARPFEFPHLYRIRAGDWRISYAVEHNRLAILVLEVLGQDAVEDDPIRETIATKVKVKLLELPEQAGQVTVAEAEGRRPRIKLSDSAREVIRWKPKVTLLDAPAAEDEAGSEGEVPESPESEGAVIEGKVTPLDSPSM